MVSGVARHPAGNGDNLLAEMGKPKQMVAVHRGNSGNVRSDRKRRAANAVADRAAFRGCYEIIAKREQEQKQLALPLQEAIKGIQLKGMDGEILKIGGA